MFVWETAANGSHWPHSGRNSIELPNSQDTMGLLLDLVRRMPELVQTLLLRGYLRQKINVNKSVVIDPYYLFLVRTNTMPVR